MKKTTIISLLLVACMATMCFVGGTFAKYTSSTTGSDTVTVAKWDISVNGTKITTTPATQAPFDLFTTSAQYDEAGDDVAAEKVAPGTKGSFNFTVQNNSEVSVKYTASFTAAFPTGLDNTRFKFYSDSAMTQELVAVDGVYTVASDVEIEVADTVADTMTVYWQWTFADDVDDSALGILAQNGTTVVTVTPTIVVNQVD